MFALQPKQEARHVETYEAYAAKVRCLYDDHVAPDRDPDLATLVVYPEYMGLARRSVPWGRPTPTC